MKRNIKSSSKKEELLNEYEKHILHVKERMQIRKERIKIREEKNHKILNIFYD